MSTVESPTESFTTDGIQRQVQLYAIGPQLNNLARQSRTKLLRHLLKALISATDAKSGHLCFIDSKGEIENCLIPKDDILREHNADSALSAHEKSLVEWVYRQRQGLLITNTATDPLWSSWATSGKSSIKSALAVPILAKGQQVGVVTLVANQPDHFSEVNLIPISNLAHQTAIILENLHLNTLLTQKQGALDALRQTARAVNSSLDLDQILHTALDQLIHAIPNQAAIVFLREGERLHTIAATERVIAEKTSSSIFTQANAPEVFYILRQDRTIVSSEADEAIDLSLFTHSEQIHAWAAAPLKARGKSLGLLLLISHAPHTYSTSHIATISGLADHVAIAIAAHHLAQETDQRLRELAFLNETGQAITSTLDLDRILQLLLERVRDLLGIDAASIALRDEHTRELVFEAASGEGAAGVLGVRLKPGQGIAGWVAETGKPLVVPDVHKDARFFPNIDRKTGMTTEAILCVPIVLKGHVVGIIEAINPSDVAFDEQAVELLTALAGLAASAIDNARLFKRVRSAEARFEGLFEDSVNPIITTDLKGNIVAANRNACALFGQSKEALQGTNLLHFRSADGHQDFVEPHNEILAGQAPVFQTTILVDKQHKTITLRGKQVPVKGTTLIQWIGRDVSAEIELEQTREDMIKMIVHDLRNPLANIMNSLDVLLDVILEKDSIESQSELINIAKRSGQRLHQLISSILDISRLETGQAILETQRTDLALLIQDVIDFVKPQADIREIHLVHHIGKEIPLIVIDSDMIARVIINLLDNAIKFTQVGGAVSLTAKASKDTVEIAVTDNGGGIPPDQLTSIFEKFARVKRKNTPKGSGLGLAFCQLAVKAHGGRIWAENNPSPGATFRLTLPLKTKTLPEQTPSG